MCIFGKFSIIAFCLLTIFLGMASGFKCYSGIDGQALQKECGDVNTCITIACGGRQMGKIFKDCGVEAHDDGHLSCSDVYCKIGNYEYAAKDCSYCRGSLCNYQNIYNTNTNTDTDDSGKGKPNGESENDKAISDFENGLTFHHPPIVISLLITVGVVVAMNAGFLF